MRTVVGHSTGNSGWLNVDQTSSSIFRTARTRSDANELRIRVVARIYEAPGENYIRRCESRWIAAGFSLRRSSDLSFKLAFHSFRADIVLSPHSLSWFMHVNAEHKLTRWFITRFGFRAHAEDLTFTFSDEEFVFSSLILSSCLHANIDEYMWIITADGGSNLGQIWEISKILFISSLGEYIMYRGIRLLTARRDQFSTNCSKSLLNESIFPPAEYATVINSNRSFSTFDLADLSEAG